MSIFSAFRWPWLAAVADATDESLVVCRDRACDRVRVSAEVPDQVFGG